MIHASFVLPLLPLLRSSGEHVTFCGFGVQTNAACIRSDASYECSCNTGWEGNGSTCTDIKECNMEDTTEDCHVSRSEMLALWLYWSVVCCQSQWLIRLNCQVSAFCQEMPGSYTCLCQPGYVGDGYTCRDQSWGIRTVFALDSLARRALDPAAIEVLKLTYGKLVLFDPLLPPNASVVTGMPFSFGALNFGESVSSPHTFDSFVDFLLSDLSACTVSTSPSRCIPEFGFSKGGF